MSDPYRTEDPVVKLQAENDKLRERYDELMLRYSAFKRWPILSLVLSVIFMMGGVIFSMGRSTAPAESHGLPITREDRRAIAGEVSRQISSDVSASLQGDLRAMVRAELNSQSVPRSEQAQPRSQTQPAQDVLALGQVVRGSIHSKSGYRQEPSDPERDWWRFNARAGDRVIFRMKRVSGNLDPYLNLYAPDGRCVGSDSDSGDGYIASLVYTFTSDGQYMLLARDYDYLGSRSSWNRETTRSGNYTLSARLYNQ